MALFVPCTIDKYRIQRQLGHQGAVGTVYLAEHTETRGTRVVKELYLLHDKDGNQLTPAEMQEAQTLFYREAEVLEGLRHDRNSIVQIRDFFGINPMYQKINKGDPATSSLLLVTEYIDGENLLQYVSRTGKLPEIEAVTYGIQIADGLQYIHDQKPPVIHRDMKPDNCIRRPNSSIVIVDFGTALRRAHPTGGTTAIGTQGYAPPEQYPGGSGAAPKTDVYATAATLYFLVSGKLPRQFPDDLQKDIKDLFSRRTISKALTDILIDSSEYDLGKRPTSEKLYKSLSKLPNLKRNIPQIDLNAYRFFRSYPGDWQYSDVREAARVYCDIKEGQAGIANPRDVDKIEKMIEHHIIHVRKNAERELGISILDSITGASVPKQQALKYLQLLYEPETLDSRLRGHI